MEENGRQNKKRRPIRRQVQRMVLFLCVAALLLTGMLWAGSLLALRGNVVQNSQNLGSEAAAGGGEALLNQMEKNLYEGVQSEAAVVGEKLERYEGYVRDFAAFAHRLYEEPSAYVPREVQPPAAENRGDYTLQLSLRDQTVDRASVGAEAGLLANLIAMWQPAMDNNKGNVASIYLCTESGFMINYDERSDLTDALFDYTGSAWYREAKKAKDVVFTAPYPDTFGRGLILTCGAPFYDENGKFAGTVCMDVLVEDLSRSVLDIDFGEDSYAFLVDRGGDIIVSPQMEYDGTFENVRDENSAAREASEQILSGKTGVTATSGGLYYAYAPVAAAGWTLVIHVPANMVTAPAEEIRADITAKTDLTAAIVDRSVLWTGVIALALFAAIIGVVVAASGSFSRRLTGPLLELRADAEHLSGGDLSHQARVRQNDEIGDLARSFNEMAGSLEEHIRQLTAVTAERERIGAELDIAAHIQSSMLPCVFPPFPQREEFAIYATMDPAKEVGGDFYDFFLVDDTHLAVVVADVSGKGVPAALFMVIGKTLIKDHTAPGRDLGEVFTEVNRLLCESNGEEMFITAFEGVLDLETGRFRFVNAGHEAPYLRRAGGTFQPCRVRPGFVLAGMEGTRYKMGELALEPGDKLFLYTDGVTEAANSRNELYGKARLASALNRSGAEPPETLLMAIKADIDAFAAGAPQFDDITMLCLEFRQRSETADPDEITVEASLENLPAVTSFVEKKLEAMGCPAKAKAQVGVAVDEVVSNIARYGYGPSSGPVTVQVAAEQDPAAVRVTFLDGGKCYNPLERPDPDVTLPAADRPVGGLGVFLVKQTMDSVTYAYEDGKNILTIRKAMESGPKENEVEKENG